MPLQLWSQPWGNKSKRFVIRWNPACSDRFFPFLSSNREGRQDKKQKFTLLSASTQRRLEESGREAVAALPCPTRDTAAIPTSLCHNFSRKTERAPHSCQHQLRGRAWHQPEGKQCTFQFQMWFGSVKKIRRRLTYFRTLLVSCSRSSICME